MPVNGPRALEASGLDAPRRPEPSQAIVAATCNRRLAPSRQRGDDGAITGNELFWLRTWLSSAVREPRLALSSAHEVVLQTTTAHG